ncbi:mitochondrial nicotinamide adenine dinucleotide transporter SLC25A51 [Venturia canescens]|uniref:mitochondrial nicotinamide adenine dinucleotide transporter SLC25A51 n=1 Tax=Venturia canescens TaxID=32260 RepID=UPI001C9C770F|nr:mitochondrial nicotinamide adenine dinucleotide transporter SLC25A51 [Venturia canescens]XP_043285443.1 mitochondrial nicotinamide adenine dinucleotide transporter SLC25A51 [Venturia canescens]XP_043285444.1 mitochondrial nicotinamide adenine dinucleotide transporter SLC25A51 [Venturia canescens]XP_043285445.1 mitochondrial nicotinamide adenine dinucleotide transporter SLC25A51 [Venturia canescens]XP_043285446.1 mitochondrial nicotinamide adenine dinucleotide transporter SLC25A51 [Venturia c
MDWRVNGIFPAVIAGEESHGSENLSQRVSVASLMKITSDDSKEFICGWGAAVINVAVTYPINKIIFRQILEGVPADTAVRQLSREGLRLLYRGILPPLCQKTLSLSIMFSVYEGCRTRLTRLTERKMLAKFIAANVAGTTEAMLMPLERVQTLLQDWRNHSKFKNTTHAFRYLLTTYGIAECYRGLVPIIYRNGLSNLTFFTLRDYSKTLMGEDESLVGNFVSGALIGGFTSTVFYPMNIVKIHMQSKIGGDFERMSVTLRELWILRDRSIRNFYKGVHLNYMRSFISWGVINAAYDFLKHFLFFTN